MPQPFGGGGLERDGGQFIAEVGLEERGALILAQVDEETTQRRFVADDEDDQSVRLPVPLGCDRRVLEREVDRSVRCLAGLRPRREISSGDDVEAGYLDGVHGDESTRR